MKKLNLLFFVLISVLFSTNVVAQRTMVIKQLNGETLRLPVSSIQEVSFDEQSGAGNQINGHEYVDLGLPSGTKWATCNVGASQPEDYGYYFAWGEITPKTTYNWSTYTLCKGSFTTMTKYCKYLEYGTVDNKINLELADDAAYKNWGGSWRMPTRAEQDELRTHCIWTWFIKNGITGYKVTSNTNGNSIFLPAAGSCENRDASGFGSSCYYWSSSLCVSSSYGADALYFNSGRVSAFGLNRYVGAPVRAVCQ